MVARPAIDAPGAGVEHYTGFLSKTFFVDLHRDGEVGGEGLLGCFLGYEFDLEDTAWLACYNAEIALLLV